MAHACDPSYSGGRDQEDKRSQPAQAKVRVNPPPCILANKLGIVLHSCGPSGAGGSGRKIMVQGWPRQKLQDYA
jgi:hypothetical protein